MSVGDALHVAGAAGRLTAVDFRFDWSQTYTFWSGLLGGLFLMLSYFGCDQSQVQRYLTAKSVEEGRDSLMMSAFVKIPLQALVLLTGVLVFVFYLFQQPPMLFNRVHAERVEKSERAAEFQPARRRVHGGLRRHAARRPPRSPRRLIAATTGRGACDLRGGQPRGQRGARPRGAAGARDYRRRALQGSDGRYAGAGRQLRLSDLRHDAAADRVSSG